MCTFYYAGLRFPARSKQQDRHAATAFLDTTHSLTVVYQPQPPKPAFLVVHQTLQLCRPAVLKKCRNCIQRLLFPQPEL